MQRNTRYDKLDMAGLGLAPAFSTVGAPITVSGEDFMRAGQKWNAVGHGVSSQVWGYMPSCQPASVIDSWLDDLVASGIGTLSVFTPDQYGLVHAGALQGRPVGPWKNGTGYVANRTWVLNEETWTTDSSGISRVYKCVVGGAGGSGSTGPTGTGTNIVDNIARWDFQRLAFTVLNEQFFAGDGVAAGFDYFMDACAKRGVYVFLRTDSWPLIYKGQTGYPMNAGTAGSPSLSSNSSYLGQWHWDGEYGTPPLATYAKNYWATVWLDRINTRNGRRYGDDPTLFALNPWNEIGHAYWYLSTSSTSSPSANTFDNHCKTGSPSGASAAEPVATYVAAWDAKWLAWYQATFPGHTPNGDFPGVLDTLPCYAYDTVNGLGNGVAARSTFRVPGTGTAPADTRHDWRVRVMRFLAETERDMVLAFKAWLRTKSSHILLAPFQSSWAFPLGYAAGDFCDVHFYPTSASPNTTGNTWAATGKAAGGGGASWSANVLTVMLKGTGATGPDASHPLANGQYVRVTAGGMSNEVVGPITTINTTDFTAPRVGDPGGLGTPVDCSVVLPNVVNDCCPWHAVTPGVNVANSTRVHAYMAGGSGETDYDAASWPGNANFGQWHALRHGRVSGMPVTCTETGVRGLTDPYQHGIYRSDHTLFELLQGGSLPYHFSWINGATQSGALEHSLPGDGASMLEAQLCALMMRYGGIQPFPTIDITQASEADLWEWYAAHNTTELYAGIGAGWPNLVSTLELTGGDSQWNAFMFARLRHLIHPTVSAKTNVTYSYSQSGSVLGGLTNPATGRLYLRRDVGYYTYENSKMCRIAGRLPANFNAPDNNALTKLDINTADGKLWYGHVTWISLDGSDLGVGRSALFSWMYPREEVQQFRRFSSTGAGGQAIEMLDGDGSGSDDTAKQPGVVMRNGLRVKLTMADTSKRAQIIERYAGSKEHPSFHSGGAMALYPTAPLLVIG